MTITKSPDKNFAWAVEEMEDSYKIARESWGYNEFIWLKSGQDHCPMFMKTIISNCGHKTVNPWFATFDDVAANDWGYA